MGRARKQEEKPLQVGQRLTVTVTDLAHDGRGVAHPQGFALFLPGLLPGEEAEVEVTEVHPHYAKGRVRRLLCPSPARREPRCPVYAACGGCQLQHYDYAAALRAKQKRVEDALTRIGKLDLTQIKVGTIVGMDDPWHYRNKAMFPVGWADGPILGAYAPGSHRVVAMEECYLQHPLENEILRELRRLFRLFRLSVYQEETGRGLLRHVLLRYGWRTGEALVGLVTAQAAFPQGKELAARLAARFPNIVGVLQNINTERTNRVLGPQTRVLWGREFLYDELGGLRFKLSLSSFFQVNPIQAERLYQQVEAYAVLTGRDILDAYCGVGSIALWLARRAARVVGIESVPAAVADARKNAALNGLANATFYAGTVETVLPQLWRQGFSFDLAVLDPPRKGCDPGVLKALAEKEIPQLIYVSCNPSTLARDLALLVEAGYGVEAVQPFDLFPQTYHVECVACLKRKDPV